MLYIGIMEGREGADNLNCLVVNDARDRARARGKRQRPVDCLWSFEADTINPTERLAARPVAHKY